MHGGQGELKYFYDQHKWLIEITAFVGLVAALFLQVAHLESSSLRMLQASLLIILSFLISYLLLNLLIYLITSRPETRVRIVVNGMIVSTFIFTIIFNLFKFLYEVFPDELLFYINYTRLGLIILISFFFEKIFEFLANRFERKKLWIFLSELIWVFLVASLWFFPKNYFSQNGNFQNLIFLGSNLLILFILSLLYNYGMIAKKIFISSLPIIALIWTTIWFLFFK